MQHLTCSLAATSRTRPCARIRARQDAVRGDHGVVVSLLLEHGGKVMSKEGALIELADSALSGNVRIFGELDPEWEIDPKQIVFQEKVRLRLSQAASVLLPQGR